MSLVSSTINLMDDEEYVQYLNNRGVVDSILQYMDNKDQAVSTLDYLHYYHSHEELFKEIMSTILKSIAESEVKLNKEKRIIDYAKIIQSYDIFLSYKNSNNIQFHKLLHSGFSTQESILNQIAIILANQKINITKAQKLIKLDDFALLPEEEKEKILLCRVVDIAENISLFIIKKDDKENTEEYKELSYSRSAKEEIH